MEKNATQQEVLFMTGSGFASSQFCQREFPDNPNNLPGNEKLMEACWNGLVKEIIPEVFMFSDPGNKMYLWKVKEAHRFFLLEMSDYPADYNKYASIDPDRFMEVQSFN
jgi:hypothetical protein